ncbi:MAG: TIGR04255 family protein [Candidatus Omnitrophota bacterium]
MDEIYKNAPLIEVVFEIRFPAEFAIKCKTDLLYHQIKSVFPIIVEHRPESGFIYDFLNKSQKEIIRLSLDRVSYHAKEYSGGFAKFQEDALKYLQLFINTYKIEKLTRTGLRYVNHMPIVKINGLVPLEKYINFGYKLPGTRIPNQFEQLHTILVVKIDTGKLKILLQTKEITDITKTEVLVLDFDFMYTGQLDAKNIVEYIAKSHTYTKDIFEDLIASEYKKVMRGDQV